MSNKRYLEEFKNSTRFAGSQMMTVHPSDYYAWKAEPASARQKVESGGIYGCYRRSLMTCVILASLMASIESND